jgi:hypothetical protein
VTELLRVCGVYKAVGATLPRATRVVEVAEAAVEVNISDPLLNPR